MGGFGNFIARVKTTLIDPRCNNNKTSLLLNHSCHSHLLCFFYQNGRAKTNEYFLWLLSVVHPHYGRLETLSSVSLKSQHFQTLFGKRC